MSAILHSAAHAEPGHEAASAKSASKSAVIEIQAGLAAENEMLRAALEQFPGGIVIYNSALHMTFCSHGVRDLLDLPEYLFEFGPPSLEQMFRFNAIRGEYGPGDIETQVQERLKLAARREPHKYRRVRPNGKIIEVRGAPLDNGGFVTAYIEVDARDNGATVRNNPDPNAIYNVAMPWAAFHEKSTMLLKQAAANTISALHFLDIDDYKSTYDRFGENGAAIMMNAIAQRIARALSPSDLLVYLGGDEFAILQYDVQRPSAVAKLDAKLIAISKPPVTLGTGSVSGAFSIGVAMAPRDGRDIDALLAKARSSMRRGRTDQTSMDHPAHDHPTE